MPYKFQDHTRTTRTPAYVLRYSPPAPWFWNFARNIHTTNLLKLLDKMYKYEMDPSRTVGATKRTQDAGQTDGWTDGWRTGWNQYTPQQLPCCSKFAKLLWLMCNGSMGQTGSMKGITYFYMDNEKGVDFFFLNVSCEFKYFSLIKW